MRRQKTIFCIINVCGAYIKVCSRHRPINNKDQLTCVPLWYERNSTSEQNSLLKLTRSLPQMVSSPVTSFILRKSATHWPCAVRSFILLSTSHTLSDLPLGTWMASEHFLLGCATGYAGLVIIPFSDVTVPPLHMSIVFCEGRSTVKQMKRFLCCCY